MLFPTLLFAVVFAVPLLGFNLYIARRDKKKKRLIGTVVITLLFICATILAYFANRGKGV